MKLKKFEGPTISRAMARIKREMGSEAVILQIKKKKRLGKFIFPLKHYFEVIAGIDVNVPEQYGPDYRLKTNDRLEKETAK